MSAFMLGDLVDIKGGGTPNRGEPSFWNGEVPWATVKDFKSTELSKTEDSITQQGVANSATNIIPAGTIVVPTRMAVGKAAVTSVDMAINQDLKALIIRDNSQVDQQYLLRFLLGMAQFLEGKAKGATVKGITLDVLREIEVPLPPLAEQKRIAAILDKADAIRRKREQVIHLADEFLRSVFLDMFSQYLIGNKITERRAIRTLLREERNAAAIGPFGSNLKVCDYRDMGHPVTFVRDIKPGRFNWVSGVYVDDDKFQELASHAVFPGDVVVTKMGMPPGIAAIYPSTMPAGIITADVIKLSINEKICDPYYLVAFLNSSEGHSMVDRISEGITRKKMRLGDFKDLEVPVPESNLQQEWKQVVRKVADLKKGFSVTSNKITELFESLSQRAFRGDL